MFTRVFPVEPDPAMHLSCERKHTLPSFTCASTPDDGNGASTKATRNEFCDEKKLVLFHCDGGSSFVEGRRGEESRAGAIIMQHGYASGKLG